MGSRKEKTLEEVQDLILIDKHNLDNEAQNHPKTFREVGKQYAFAKSRKAEAKLEVDQVYAVVSLEYRNGAADSGEKMTEDKLKQLVRSDERHINACCEYAEAEKEESLWENEKDAQWQRGSAIRDLIRLYASDYFFTDIVEKKKDNKTKAKQQRQNK